MSDDNAWLAPYFFWVPVLTTGIDIGLYFILSTQHSLYGYLLVFGYGILTGTIISLIGIHWVNS